MKNLLISAASASALLFGAAQAATVTVDTFLTPQGPNVSSIDGVAASSSVSGAGILGGTRTLTATRTSSLINSTTEGLIGAGFFAASNGALTLGTVTTAYNGLGGVDLTDGGLNDAFRLGVNSIDQSALLSISVTDTNGFTSSSALIASTVQDLTFSFAAFVGDVVDFTSLNNVVLTFDSNGVTGADGTFTFLGAIDTNPVPVPPAALLFAPALAGAVWTRRKAKKAA